MHLRPLAGALAVDVTVAQQLRRDAVTRRGPRAAQIITTTHQIPQALRLRRRRLHVGQLPTAVQAHQLLGVTPVGLDPVTRGCAWSRADISPLERRREADASAQLGTHGASTIAHEGILPAIALESGLTALQRGHHLAQRDFAGRPRLESGSSCEGDADRAGQNSRWASASSLAMRPWPARVPGRRPGSPAPSARA